MNNKVVNKQIPLDTIKKIADYLEDYKEKYEKIFELEEIKNKNIPFGEKDYEKKDGSVIIRYNIDFKNGKSITENDYNWFVGNLSNARIIKSISIDFFMHYYTKSANSTVNEIYNKVNLSLYFREFDATIDVETANQEIEAHSIHFDIMSMLDDNEERYNKTIKNRKLRIQSFCISIGILLSYILYIILVINESKLHPYIASYLDNKYILIFGQWFIAILLGNVCSYWYMLSLYRPLLPDTKYAGYNHSTGRSNYTDDIDDYLEHSEIHFGRNWDAEKRRRKIEKLYKITRLVLLVQVVISVILYLVLK